MDQIFERLERLVKGWVDATADSISPQRGTSSRHSFGDPDLDAAMAELDDFLDTSRTETQKREEEARRAQAERERRAREHQSRTTGQSSSFGAGAENTARVVEEAYRYLGMAPYAPIAEVKAAYKKLLFKYHPDRNAASPEQLKKATETSTKINSAYQIIEAWEESRKQR